MASATAKVALEDYLTYLQRSKCSPESIRSYRYGLGAFLGHCTSHRLPIRDDSVEGYLSATYPNPATKNKILGQIRSYVKWCNAKGKRDVQALTLKKYHKPKTIPTTVTDKDADAFIAALHSMDETAWALAVLIRATGMRIGEVAQRISLESFYTDTEGNGYLRFFGKGNKERIVPLVGEAENAFSVWMRERDSCSLRTIRRRFVDAEKRAGISHLRPHWFRHTMATKLVNDNHSFTQISYLLGNTEAVCQNVYGRSDQNRLREMLAR